MTHLFVIPAKAEIWELVSILYNGFPLSRE